MLIYYNGRIRYLRANRLPTANVLRIAIDPPKWGINIHKVALNKCFPFTLYL